MGREVPLRMSFQEMRRMTLRELCVIYTRGDTEDRFTVGRQIRFIILRAHPYHHQQHQMTKGCKFTLSAFSSLNTILRSVFQNPGPCATPPPASHDCQRPISYKSDHRPSDQSLKRRSQNEKET
jgi:hypothetical protein